ncbi:MAG: hypothetical protein V1831_02875 [Candidatus Woesearchaeota archaeon]
MVNQNANYYGVLLLIFMFVVVLGFLTGEPKTAGFAVKEKQSDYAVFDIEPNEQGTCADGSFYGECSSITKPKFCFNGDLVNYCELCGCDSGETCSNRECVAE